MVRSFVFIGLILCFCATLIPQLAFAELTNEELVKRVEEMEARIKELEARLARQENKTVEVERIAHGAKKEMSEFIGYKPGEGVEIKPAGLTIGAGATFILQGTANANGDDLAKNGEDVTDASYSMDLEFEKTFDDYGVAFLHLETGDGAGVEDELKVFSNVNRDADDSDSSVSVTEAWYEHYFKSVPVTLTFGKLDPTSYIDSNEYANDECAQFLGHVFRNSPVLGFPDDNTAGVRTLIEPVDFLEIELTAMDANADWEDAFDNMFLAGQLNIKPSLLDRPGNYRFYGWINDNNHVQWGDALKTKEDGYGFGLSFDQEITDVLGLFARYGWQYPEVYADGSDFSLKQTWSAGLQITGSLWNRQNDIFGIAFGQVFPSEDYKKANNLKANPEEHLEAYYNIKVNDHLSVSPDLQVLWDPYGQDATNGNETIVIGSVRAQVDF